MYIHEIYVVFKKSLCYDLLRVTVHEMHEEWLGFFLIGKIEYSWPLVLGHVINL